MKKIIVAFAALAIAAGYIGQVSAAPKRKVSASTKKPKVPAPPKKPFDHFETMRVHGM